MSKGVDVSTDRSNVTEAVHIGRNLGTKIRNLDLSQPLTENELAVFYRAFLESEALVLRNRNIEAPNQLAFGRLFGGFSIHPFSPNLCGMPELIVLNNHLDNPTRLTNKWHSDETFRETPPHEAGDHRGRQPLRTKRSLRRPRYRSARHCAFRKGCTAA